MITQDKDVQVAIGSKLKGNESDRTLKEWLTNLNVHVRYVHTKYMLIDPLSEDPITITGSANFSNASTKNNDENMLIDRGDTRLADCYLSEFMRLFNHFYFRDVVNRMSAEPDTDQHSSTYLKSDNSWTVPYYQANSVKCKKRLLFRGSDS
jgi:phosphatidylserine/phosphatidylglycerophosphate/cardiolipin synthase-like enzyme